MGSSDIYFCRSVHFNSQNYKMLKAFCRRPLLSLVSKSLFSSSEGKDRQSLVLMNKAEKFYRNIYGLEMKKHILPFCVYTIPWSMEQMQEYRKKMPTYVVVLVSKILEEAEEIERVK